MHDSDSPFITRQRLLEAAGEVFAERGFRDATVRDICRRADANVAAVKYHFGGKDELYAEAVKYAHDCAKRYAIDAGLAAKASAQQRLHAFVRGFLQGILEAGKPAWHGKLMAREISEPTGVLDKIVSDGIRPRDEALSAIVREILGPGASRETIRLCANSVVGQILFYHFAAPVLARLHKDRKFDASSIDELAEHITVLSFTGVRALARRSKS